jgi:hypothetical protein
LTSLTFSPDGFTFGLSNGRTRQYEWTNAKWEIEMTRRLETPLEPLLNPSATWHISLRSPGASGELSAEAYEALIAEARRAGRDVVSTRQPESIPPQSFWTVETRVRSPLSVR